jgi:acyl CoA:acetate/3-ketoacid CoA transferase beta subunit
VTTLVTDVGVFEKTGGEETFTLTTYVPARPKQALEEAIGEIRDKVGWELKVSPNLKQAQPVAKEEVTLLRLFDPKGFFT